MKTYNKTMLHILLSLVKDGGKLLASRSGSLTSTGQKLPEPVGYVHRTSNKTKVAKLQIGLQVASPNQFPDTQDGCLLCCQDDEEAASTSETSVKYHHIA
jgi:hypothetical protein